MPSATGNVGGIATDGKALYVSVADLGTYALDFGGNRNPDGQGFGAFGRVVSGMDVVRKIQAAPSSTTRKTNAEAQRLTPPIKIIKVARFP